MSFCEEDFDIFAESDEDACIACRTRKCKGRLVSDREYEDYYDLELKVKLDEPKFKPLSQLIVAFLEEHFHITLKYEFEPISKNPKKRPLCYANLTQATVGTGQTNAQFNLRLSYDRRPDRPGMTWNDIRRYRKFGIKFALHDKCRPTPEKDEKRNRDLPILAKNVRSAPDRFLKLLRGLKDDFLIYTNMWEGIQPNCFRANTINRDQLQSLFPSEDPNDVPFQEIHRSLYWRDPNHRKIIKDHNKLAAECVKTILRLYPFFLYATIPDFGILSRKLDSFYETMEKKKELLNCNKILRLERKESDVRRGEEAGLGRLFHGYVADATQVSIYERFLGASEQLPETIYRLCNMVDRKRLCKIHIYTPRFDQLTYKERGNLDRETFESRINQLREDIISLGFNEKHVQLDFSPPEDRVIKTDKWTITEQTGHPLDFIGRSGRAKRPIHLIFEPVNRTKFA